jgi:hypothetical protein
MGSPRVAIPWARAACGTGALRPRSFREKGAIMHPGGGPAGTLHLQALKKLDSFAERLERVQRLCPARPCVPGVSARRAGGAR